MSTPTSRSWRRFLAATMFVFLCSGSTSRTVDAVQTSKLQVIMPKDLRKPGDGYDHRDALFGIPPYGGSIQQQVIYTGDTFCGSELNKKKAYPHHKGEWKTPFILMVDRGDCTFVQKVRNAQKNGASAVLIADDMCLCDRQTCKPDEEAGEYCEVDEPIMADDGSGSDISIPSFLVFKEDADEIKQTLMDNTQVRVQMSFKVPAPDSRVEYDLWTHPSDANSRPIEKSWGVAALALAEHASFTPHHYVYDGIRAGCQDEEGNNQCYNLCTNNGLYCSTDPDDDLDMGASGADVVIESLRRICIWNLYGKDDGVGEKWWDYVTNFIDQCDSFEEYQDNPALSKFNDPECVSSALLAANVDEQKVNDCMTNAGGAGEFVNSTNVLLDKEISDQEALGVVLIPSLLVNSAVVRGSLSFSTVLKAVCSGFAAGSEPDICKECANCQDEEKCVTTNGYCPAKHTDESLFGIGANGVSIQTFAVVLVGMLLVFAVAIAIQHIRQQNQMREQIRGIVQEYMPVTEAQGQDTSLALPQDDDDDDGDANGSGPSSFSIT
mmetsp:Transcript_21507/g.46625  ORF Transcript_21507/g.46625 Transcript_21507/m.46625 type:complete len:550 (+) Transcript_21507:166-1815(+)